MSGIVWERAPSALADDIVAYGQRVMRALEAVGDLLAALLQSEAQANASWTDRTGQARAGLTGVSEAAGDLVTVYLYHGADHGKWLEIARGGPYKIIMPTIMANFGRAMELLAGILG